MTSVEGGTALLSLCLLLFCWSCSSFKIEQSASSSPQDWNYFGGHASRSGFVTKTMAPPLRDEWVYKAAAAIGPSLVVADGVLYLVTLNGRLEAVSVETGKQIAKKKLQDKYAATCAYDNGKLIIASRYGDKTLSKINLSSGVYEWRIDAGDIESEPLIDGQFVYVSALYQHIDKYNIENGEKIWTYETGGHHHSSPALSENQLVVGCDNGSVYALDAEAGKLNWEFEAGASVFATPVIANGVAYVGSLDSTLYALSLRDGAIQWQFRALSPIYETSACDGKNLVFGCSDGKLYCLDSADGAVQWKFEAKSSVSTSPLISGDVVYFGSLDKKYYCLDISSGEVLWVFHAGGRVRTSPVIWGDYLFGAAENRSLYAFRKQ